MSLFFFPHIFNDFWNEFNHRLWVPDFKNVVDFQVCSVGFEPLLFTLVVLSDYFCELVFVELPLNKFDNFTLALIKLCWFGDLFYFLINNFFINDHLALLIDSFGTEDSDLWSSLLIGSIRGHHDYVRLLAGKSFGADAAQSVLRLLFAGSLGHAVISTNPVGSSGIVLRKSVSMASPSILRASIVVARVVLF